MDEGCWLTGDVLEVKGFGELMERFGRWRVLGSGGNDGGFEFACNNKWRESGLFVAHITNCSCYKSSQRQIPSLPLSLSNCVASNALVNKSAI